MTTDQIVKLQAANQAIIDAKHDLLLIAGEICFSEPVKYEAIMNAVAQLNTGLKMSMYAPSLREEGEVNIFAEFATA